MGVVFNELIDLFLITVLLRFHPLPETALLH